MTLNRKTSSKNLLLQKEASPNSPTHLALLDNKAKCDMQDTHVHCHWSSLKTFHVLKMLTTLEDCSFEEILTVITNQVCFV